MLHRPAPGWAQGGGREGSHPTSLGPATGICQCYYCRRQLQSQVGTVPKLRVLGSASADEGC